jgi:hypothetical protein
LLIVAGVLTASSLVGGEDSRGRAHVPISVRLALAAAGILLYFPGRALYRRGKKLSAISAGDLLKADTRAPVLYLRAFKDDPVASQTPSTNYAQLFGVIHGEEEQIAEVLAEVGPVVALGRPGEPLPELGAARMYVADDDWQQTVIDLMRKARLVVYRATETQAFTWEVERGGELLSPEKVVFLIPDEVDYERFRARVDRLLPGKLPDRKRSKIKCGTLAGLVYFQPGWQSHFVMPSNPRFTHQIRRPLVPVLKVMLEPIHKQLGQPWSPPRVRWELYAGCLIFVVMLLGFVALLILAASTRQ